MKTRSIVLIGMAFVLGTVIGAWAAKKGGIDPSLYSGKPPKEAAAALLEAAKGMAEKEGSWERIYVGRGYYLGGRKEEGQALFDQVTSSKKIEGGDWIRIGRVYWEAGEWDKAKEAFAKALQKEPNDAPWLAEVGAYYNIKGDRAKAEEMFGKSFALEPNELWNTTKAAASYVNVIPD